MKSKEKFNPEIVSTVIGEETTIKGIIHTQRSLRVEGAIEGEINAQGEVYIGEKSHIKANIIGKTVIVAGEVIGNIEAIKGLKICKTGKVFGNISGDHLLIEEGGIYKGQVNMDVISSKNAFEGTIELERTR